MISDLDRTLEQLLRKEFGAPLPFDLSYAIPDKSFTPVSNSRSTLDCYLYDIRENTELRGLDPFFVACEGRLVAFLPERSVDTIWDCASLTKPLVTTLLALQRFALDDVIHGYTVRELLTHTSGLRAWLPLYTYPSYVNAILDHGPQIERRQPQREVPSLDARHVEVPRICR